MATEWKKGSEPETGYHLTEDSPFARGGSGEVWKAVGPGGIRVVLKRVPLAGSMAEAERKSLEVLRNLSAHPHLLGIHGFWIHENELVIATELASASLTDRLRQTGGAGIPLKELLDYMEDAAKGIDFLNSPIHSMEGKQVAIQHRDIKPSNLLLVGGSVKLSDFGLAKALESQNTSHTGVMTPAYAAPEAFLHETSNRSDQYSLAASYVELRTGQGVFSGSIAQIMYGHIHGQPDLSRLTEPEAQVVGRALAKNPADRFASCREFVTNLRQSLDSYLSALAAPTSDWPNMPSGVLPQSVAGTGLALEAKHAVAVATQGSTVPSIDAADTAPNPQSAPRTLSAAIQVQPARKSILPWAVLALAAAAIVMAGVVFIPRPLKPAAVAQLGANQNSTNGPGQTDSVAEQTAKPDADKLQPPSETPRSTEPEATSTDQQLVEKPTKTTEQETTKAPPDAEPQDRTETKPREQSEPRKTAVDSPADSFRIEVPRGTAKGDSPPEPKKTGDQESPEPRTTEVKRPESGAAPQDTDTKGGLAEQSYAIIKKYCYRCHGVDFKVPGLNMLDRDLLVAKRGADELPYVTPGKPDDSYIWQRVSEDADMPPTGAKPSDSEKETLKKWIESGAPFPGRSVAVRAFVSEKDVLTVVRDHLRKTPTRDRNYQRYFTLTHLSNNKTVRDDELRLYRAALSKMANSVSWKHSIVVPEPIDQAGTIFNVDLRELGWDEAQLWKEILKVYPYGLKHSQHPDEAMRELAQDVYHMTGSDMPYLRADWFIATAARPPLYHTLLMLPKSALELEKMLKVDVEKDFIRNKLYRAGFATSGVSSQNRLVDRHAGVYGSYWKSYDFNKSEGPGNIFQFPLGPVFNDNPFSRQAFEHAGGELIFNLPNGLHGFLLVDQKGNRIDAGPVDIVYDELKTSGTPTIVPGISCMACHKHGMVPFKDTLREGIGVAGEAREKVELLTPKQDAMDRILKKDSDQYLAALREATEEFLKVGDDQDKDIKQFPEPVGAIARLYVKDMSADEVALELGVEDAKQLQAMVRANAKLRQLGLGPLVQGAKIKREAWESLKGFNSPFQEAARELELGTPFRMF